MAPNYRLKQARELRGWSQAKVAEQIETDATTVSRWERGIFYPTPYFREKLCVLFEKNAEELGLLESLRTSQLQQTEAARLSGIEQQKLSPPSEDIFAYILESASQDQQAYMLWEHAYVQALRGQYEEAQQLGEASLNVFEQSGHPKAAAIRAWLLQHELLSSQAPSTGDLAHDIAPAAPSPPGKSARSRFPWGGAGVLFAIILTISGLLTSLSFYRLNNSSFSSVPLSSSQQRQTTSFTSLSDLPIATHVPSTVPSTPLPHPTATTHPTAPTPSSITTPPVTSTTFATLSPSQLTSHSCVPDSQTFRCTLTLMVGASSQEIFIWQASSPGIIAQINPPNGQITSGQPFQIIVYISQSSTQKGSLVFTLHASASGDMASASASWQY